MATDTTTASPPAEEPSLRDSIDAAFEQHATDEVDASAAPSPAQAADDARVRDELGRFKSPVQAPASPAEAPTAAPGTTGTPQPSAAPQPPELKAPASWRPEVREKWNALDPEVRSEVHRREIEAQRVLQQGAQARQFIEQFEATVRPYEMFLRTENSDPLTAVGALFRTAGELRVGTPINKANLVAGICKTYGIDMGLLDSALANNGFVAPGDAPAQQQQPPMDPRFTQYLAQQEQLQRQQAQQEDQNIRSGLQAFAQAHEFYGDVAPLMADLIEMAGRRGEVLPIERAYAQACKMHEGVSTILSQRAASPAAPSPAVLRARRAAVSVKGAPTPDGATVPKTDSVRGAIEAAFDAHSGS